MSTTVTDRIEGIMYATGNNENEADMLWEVGLQQMGVEERRIYTYYLEVELYDPMNNPLEMTAKKFHKSEREIKETTLQCATYLHKFVEARR
ncbi:hypothetical protein [Bacillus sp. FJAT-44742]|uniref:hypothetical protein n=1 Tax=Bacillus sp. FJAT-44742 TaxID=2014005 RepID=UPI000C246F91|nr:hypothetical protein [Bacillus sp. FJAT-44742]